MSEPLECKDVEIDELSRRYGKRSALIEKAIREFLNAEANRRRDIQDKVILNHRADALNRDVIGDVQT